jgi:alanyl-tRNA synthetase
MFQLVKVLSETMGKSFPELKDQRQLIENVVKEEEHSFLKTIGFGITELQKQIDLIKLSNKDINASKQESDEAKITGGMAFYLYDTCGFPLDLTELIAEENGLAVNIEGFNKLMLQQKDRSRSASEVTKEDWIVLAEDPQQEFVGYDNLETSVKIVKYRKVTSKKEGEQYQIVFNLTPFYPEGGGQVGDKGYLEAPNGDVVYILDTKKENNEIVHFAKNLPRDTTDKFKAVVDAAQRRRTECNHTATHLLHQALREILGTHVEQKGSAVHSKYLRFDFSHFAKLSADELAAIESFVNARINNGLPLEEQRNVPMEKALEQGAMALFGEKYGDAVRTVRFGRSIELCGGTHVRNTADIWHFKIRSEGAVAAGIRRIEAITSDAVKDFYTESNNTLLEVKELLNNSQEPVKALITLQEENLRLKKEVENLLKEKAKSLKGELLSELAEVNGIQFLAKKVDLDAGGIKDISFEIGQNRKDLFLLFASEDEGKAFLSCYISKEVVEDRKLNAGTIVRELGKYIQGGGGGQPFFATAGGKNPGGIEEALKKAKNYIVSG